MSDPDNDYTGLLLEQIRDQNRAVLEAVTNLPTRIEFNELKEDPQTLKSDARVIKAAVADLSTQLTDHEHRITRLEAAA